MVKLYCVVIGVPGSVFQEIKTRKPDTVKCEADLLKLFLEKKESGVWLTEEDVENGVKNTAGLKPLKSALSKIGDVVLSEMALRPEVTKEEVAALKGTVDVVVDHDSW
ncbi:hypothetical protein V7S43_002861 [Phytophthora oleae]|uniref:Uncharacterized protein n=1 Tax=Phytophthora oleae TaxID=2107226 RepID=A0ABD3G4V1_9STRA